MGCRWKRLAKVLVAVATLLLLQSAVHVRRAEAQMGGAFPQFSWGGRFQASLLEGAPANDSFASIYNPAALRACSTGQISVHQIRPFDVPLTGISWCAGTRPDARVGIGGHVIVRQSPPGLGFDYNTYQIGVALAMRRFVRSGAVTVGATPKLLIVSIDGTGTPLDEAAVGYALDAGFSYDRTVHIHVKQTVVFDRVAVDLSAIDRLSRMHYGSGAVEPGATPLYRLAVSLSGPRFTTGVSARGQDGGMTFGAGVEYTLFRAQSAGDDVLRQIVVRGGVDEHGASVGLGITLRGFATDYAYRMGGDDNSHVFSTGWHF